MFEPINLKNELIKERGLPQKTLMEEVDVLLQHAEESDKQILSRLRKGSPKNSLIEPISIKENDSSNIFNLSEIKNVCVNYRLRFLDPKLYKGEYPYEALIKIREFEKRNGCEIKEFKLMAPTKMFKLIDPDKDPLLFANIGHGNYYLIHQWGNDLAWYRKFLAWPVRNLKNILLSIITIAFLFSFLIPDSVFPVQGRSFGQIYLARTVIFFLFMMGSFALTLRMCIRLNKNLNDLDWDNRFLY